MDVTDKDLLFVRVKEGTKYWIQVMHRLTGDIINEIPPMCDHHHYVRVRKYPRDQDYIFESCFTCEETYAHSINTGESVCVLKGSKIFRMCDGPARSLLVMNTRWMLSKLDWDKTQHKAQLVFIQKIPKSSGKSLLKLCYVECHNIFMYTVKDKREGRDYEIIAVKLGSDTIVWRLLGSVDGHVIKPSFITCDTDGNAYVNDRGNNRILKIDSLTGEVLSILLFEEKEITIHSMRWSDTEPNLTIRRANDISTYFVPK